MAGELTFADPDTGASKADGCCFLEGEAQGMCGAAKSPGPERGSSFPVAA